MSGPWIGKAIPRLTLCAGLLALCGSGFAQNSSAVPVSVAGQSNGSAANGSEANSSAAAQSSAAPASGQRTDSQIEMDVVKALDDSTPLKNDLITAATIQSEVTLSGTVASQADKDLAASIAGGVQGVSKVHNNLKIGNPQQAAQDQGFPIGDSGEEPPVAGSDQGQPPQGQQPQPPPMNTPDMGQDNGQGGAQAPMPEGQQPPPWNAPGPDQGQAGPEGQGGYPPPYPPPPSRAPYPGNPGSGYPGSGYPGSGYPGQYPPPYPGQGQPPYPDQGQQQYPGQYPPQYPNQGQPQQPAYEQPKGPVTIPAGTLLRLRTAEPVSSKKATQGTPVQFTVIGDVAFGGVLAIPRGATIHGQVTETQQAGQLGGHAEFALQLTSLDLGGRSYPIESDLFKVKGPSKAGYTAGNVAGGAVLGAIIGGIAGGGSGAAIGAGVGAGAGTAASAATRGPGAWIPPEALVTFHLAVPLTVQPVSQQEANRLAAGLNSGGPSLYRRGPYRYGPYGRVYPNGPPPSYYGPYGPYGPYPPVYYRPYYMIGGVYYWR